jgi:hypothetical protein
MVTVDAAKKLFPLEPLSAKLFAATTVPVRFKMSPEAKSVVGVPMAELDVLIANDYLPGSVVFMRFYMLASGLSWVWLRESSEKDARLPIFRYNRGYKPLRVKNA